jgi:uncharacterized protein (TIGR03083 family)
VTTLEDLQTGLQLASAEVLAFLRSGPDVYALTPGGEWTVRETGVHLICGTRMYVMMLEGRPSPFQTLGERASVNAGCFIAMDETEPTVLANQADRAVKSFLDVTSRHRRDDPLAYGAFSTTVGIMAAFQCYEYLLHGYDMARGAGRHWHWQEPAADAALTMMGPVLTYMFGLNPDAAGELHGSFAIESPRARLCLDVRHGVMELLDRDVDTDCSIVGSSSQVLLWLSGRAGWEDAGLTASGPRPDLAKSLTDMTRTP